jgi:hypothetical protein
MEFLFGHFKTRQDSNIVHLIHYTTPIHVHLVLLCVDVFFVVTCDDDESTLAFLKLGFLHAALPFNDILVMFAFKVVVSFDFFITNKESACTDSVFHIRSDGCTTEP